MADDNSWVVALSGGGGVWLLEADGIVIDGGGDGVWFAMDMFLIDPVYARDGAAVAAREWQLNWRQGCRIELVCRRQRWRRRLQQKRWAWAALRSCLGNGAASRVTAFL